MLCLSVLIGMASLFASPGVKRLPSVGSQPQSQQTVPEPTPSGNISLESTLGNVGFFAGSSTPSVLSRTISGAPSRISESGASVYGGVIFSNVENVANGLVEVLPDGTVKPLFDMKAPSGGTLTIKGLYMREGNIYCIAQETNSIFLYGTYLFVYSTDGTLIKTVRYGTNDLLFNYLAYDPKNDMVYGYIEETVNMTSTVIYFATAPGASPNTVTKVAEMDGSPVCGMTYNQVTDRLIGICSSNNGGKVVEISTFDGSQKQIATLSSISNYITGICYSPMDNAYFYGLITTTGSSIQLLDDKFQTLSSKPYAGQIEYCALVCSDPQNVSPSAPGEAIFKSFDFPKGSLSGTVTYQMPSASYGDVPLLGNVNWILMVDDVEVKRGTSAAGSTVAIPASVTEEGMHYFCLKVSTGNNFGPYVNNTLYIGKDTPVAPAEVTLTDTTISWTPVDTGIHGGYVDGEEVTYNVYLNDTLIASEIKAASCPSHIPQGEEMYFYVAYVEAVYAGKVSEKTGSNDLPYGDPFNIPVSFEPTQNEAQLFTIVDANNDKKAIEFSASTFQGYGDVNGFMYKESSKQADDWLFLPAVNFADADAAYEFSLNIFRIMANYTNTFEVKLATAPDPDHIIKTILPETQLLNQRPQTDVTVFEKYFTAIFDVPSAGVYYVGVHITSPKNGFNVFMHDFSVKKLDNITGASPLGAVNVVATAAAGGKLNADVMFVFPSTSINGTAYPSDKTLKATVQAEGCEAVTIEGAPGSVAKTNVGTLQGENTISVTILDGELTSPVETTTVYTGVEIPGLVTNLTATTDATGYVAHLTWEAPTQGSNGGYIEPTGINYYLCEYDASTYQWIATKFIGTDVFSYDFEVDEDTPQALVNLGVITQNFVGDSPTFQSTSALIGKPFEIPATCNYSAGESLAPIVKYSNSYYLYQRDPKTNYTAFATSDNAIALYLQAYSDYTAKYTIPMFSTKGTKNAAIKINTYGGSTSSFSVVASAYGVDEKVVKTFTSADFTEQGPQYVTIDLGPEFQDKDWVLIGFEAKISRTETFIVYDYQVFDNVPFDFGVTSIEGSTIARIGEDNTFTAHITNFGSEANPMPASNWTLVDDDENVIANVNIPAGTEPIQPGEEKTFELAFSPTADQIGNYTLTYTIDKADNKETNDSKTINISVEKGLKPVITDLSAQDISFDNVTLGWSPIMTVSGIVESFEEETPLQLDDVTDMLASFKRVDGDKKVPYLIDNEAYQTLPEVKQPFSYLVWSADEMNQLMGTNYKAYSGDKFLVAICPSPDATGVAPAADDWLISPEVAGGTDISFAVRPMTYNYGAEVIEVMYSTTSDNPEDFKLLETVKITGEAGAAPVWEEHDFALPANAKYFAIHYVSKDIFGIMLDDISFTPLGDEVKITGFDIYRDGVLIASGETCSDNTYTDSTVNADTEYTYNVVPVLGDGSYGLESNTLRLRTTGVSAISADDSTDAEYYDIRGFRVNGNLEPGVYLRKEGDKVRKVIIMK